MSLNLIRPKIETEDLLLSITKNCETLINQTLTTAQETLEFKMVQSKKLLILFHISRLKDLGWLD